ncbi:uncharacterized protein ARMOST_12833 [Armillaria ostoyae]|uniref:Uncharacterized protein n=1 Tax=Armillaria ostoyae TaxID=47428 RepID=A0A284RL68_ARMOS|nr:uncharacterized protein ARMOST_12833 [Armillaria ostoyae]
MPRITAVFLTFSPRIERDLLFSGIIRGRDLLSKNRVYKAISQYFLCHIERLNVTVLHDVVYDEIKQMHCANAIASLDHLCPCYTAVTPKSDHSNWQPLATIKCIKREDFRKIRSGTRSSQCPLLPRSML